MIEKRKYPYFSHQTWQSIFFFNWPVDPTELSSYIPEPFKLDLFEGQAWISLVLFSATNSRLRFMPQWTSVPPVTQMNLRTYVYSNTSSEKGVYFFSIRLNNLLATLGGKSLFQLPFHNEKVDMKSNDGNVIVNQEKDNILKFSYELINVDNDQLAHFLTERYCIWNVKGKKLIKIPISHPKWTVQQCMTEDTETKLFKQLELPRFPPLTYYCRKKHTRLYPYEKYGYYSY